MERSGNKYNWRGGPRPRRYAAFAYDPDLQGSLLRGGSKDGHGGFQYGDAWLFKNGAWKPLGESFDTDSRDDHGVGYHRAAKRLVLLEGLGGARQIPLRGSSD